MRGYLAVGLPTLPMLSPLACSQLNPTPMSLVLRLLLLAPIPLRPQTRPRVKVGCNIHGSERTSFRYLRTFSELVRWRAKGMKKR